MKLFCLLTGKSGYKGYFDINGYHRKLFLSMQEAKAELINWFCRGCWINTTSEGCLKYLQDNHYNEYGEGIFKEDHVYVALGDTIYEAKIVTIDVMYNFHIEVYNLLDHEIDKELKRIANHGTQNRSSNCI